MRSMKKETERQSSCVGKKRFHDWPTASKAAGRKGGRQPYYCRFCQGFHVGHKKIGRAPRYQRSKVRNDDV